MGTTISFSRASGGSARGYLAEAKDPRAPGVAVIQEWWGVQGQIRSVCDRLAEAGFTALAPDLFEGRIIPYHDEAAAAAAMRSLDFKAATGEVVRGALRQLKSRGGKAGLAGFCMGGAIAVVGAVHIPEVDAAVDFYGMPPEAVAAPEDIRVPFQGHFASRDGWVTPAVADAFEARLKKAGKSYEIYRYEAEHAFMNSDRKNRYDPGAAKLAWERCLDFLRRHLVP